MNAEKTNNLIIMELIGTYLNQAAQCTNNSELQTQTLKMFQLVSETVFTGSKVYIQQPNDDYQPQSIKQSQTSASPILSCLQNLEESVSLKIQSINEQKEIIMKKKILAEQQLQKIKQIGTENSKIEEFEKQNQSNLEVQLKILEQQKNSIISSKQKIIGDAENRLKDEVTKFVIGEASIFCSGIKAQGYSVELGGNLFCAVAHLPDGTKITGYMRNNRCYYPFEGKEHEAKDFTIFEGQKFVSNEEKNQYPSVGVQPFGQEVWHAIAKTAQGRIPGKVHRNEDICWYGFKGQEHTTREFDVVVKY